MNLKKNLIILVLTLSLTSISAQEIDSPNTEFTLSDTICIASEPDYPPYCVIKDNGEADGFSVELFQAAAAAVDIKVNTKIGIWNQIKQDLAEGRIDALPLVGRTPEREKLFDFTFPYMSLHGAIFVRENTTGIDSVEDLMNKTIIVMQGDNAEEFVRRENISKEIITTPTFEDAFRMLASGQHDAIITQRVMGLQLLKKMDLKSIIPLDIQLDKFRQDFCFAVQEGDRVLLSRLNEGLSIVIANGTFDEIHRKWFSPVIQKYLSLKDIIKTSLYFIIPFILLSSVIMTVVLRSQVKKKTRALRQEIAEHRRTGYNLHKQQMLLKKMEKITKVGGWEYNTVTQKMKWTDGAYAIHGVSPADFDPSDMNKNITFYHPQDHKKIKKALRGAIEYQEPYDLNLRFILADGTQKWVRTIGRPELKDGKVVRIYGNILDITAQKENEDKLKELKNELETKVAERTAELEEKVAKLHKSEKAMLYMVEDLNKMTQELKNEQLELAASNKELEAFSYSVSHDLRAPLRSIDGFSRFLLQEYKDKLDDKGVHYLERIRAGSQCMGALIDDLLSLSRTTRKPMQWQEVNLSKIAHAILDELRNQDPERALEVNIREGLIVHGDYILLKAAIDNLMDNAWKFTKGKKKTRISFDMKVKQGKKQYFIKDNGAGFNPKYADKLFSPFQRLHSSKEFPGTGIGLANMYRIIRRHGGNVWAESKGDGKGATFYFTLSH